MTTNDISLLLAEVGLTELTQEIMELILPSIRFTVTPVAQQEEARGSTRFNGLPDLSSAVIYPTLPDFDDGVTGDLIGGPLAFLLQFNLRDIAELLPTENLPQSGLLSFFAAPWVSAMGYGKHEDCCKVYHIETPQDGFSLSPLPVMSPEFRQQYIGRDGFAYTKGHLDLTLEYTLPDNNAPSSIPFWKRMSSVQQQAYIDLLDRMKVGYAGCQFVHRLLGHAQLVQYEMNSLLKEVRDTEWRLLLQLDTEPAFGFEWQAWGRGYFWIPADDLKQRDFNRVYCIMQCT